MHQSPIIKQMKIHLCNNCTLFLTQTPAGSRSECW